MTLQCPGAVEHCNPNLLNLIKFVQIWPVLAPKNTIAIVNPGTERAVIRRAHSEKVGLLHTARCCQTEVFCHTWTFSYCEPVTWTGAASVRQTCVLHIHTVRLKLKRMQSHHKFNIYFSRHNPHNKSF